MINYSLHESLAYLAMMFPAFLIAISFHEFSHAFMAYLLGDDTAKNVGRLTLNPLAHLDFFGTILLLFVGVGWAKPVPFNEHNFKHPRFYSVLTALAGPLSNFILAVFFFICLKYLPIFDLSLNVFTSLQMVFLACAQINIALGVFNLLPIPPLDGSHLILVLLKNKFPNLVIWLYRYSLFILLGFLFLPFTRDLLFNLINFVLNFIKDLVF
jgi:Zn-dependent protease